MKTVKRHYFFSLILIIAFFAVTSFLFEGHAYFSENHSRSMSDLEFFLSSGVALFLLIGIFVLAKKNFHLAFNWVLAATLGVFFLTSVLALCLFPGVSFNQDNSGPLNAVTLCRYLVLTAILFLSLYVIIGIIPAFTTGSFVYQLAFLAAVIAALSAAIDSYIYESSFYAGLFLGDAFSMLQVPKSFTANRNIYALMLFFGLAGEAYLNVTRPHWWRWLFIAFFYLNQLFPCSKTGIAISTLFLSLFIIWSFFRSLKSHPLLNSLSLGIFLLSLGGMTFFLFFTPDGLLFRLKEYVQYVYASFVSGASASLATRFDCFSIAFSSLLANPFTLWFGFGYGNWPQALYFSAYGSSFAFLPMDSAWAVDFLQNGFFGFGLSLLLWGYAFFVIFRAMREKNAKAWVILFLTLSLLARTMTEAGDFTYLNASGIVFFGLTVLPLSSDHYRWANKAINEENESVYFQLRPKTLPPESPLLRHYALLFPLVAVFAGLYDALSSLTRCPIFKEWYFLANVSFLFLSGPLALAGVAKLRKEKHVFGFWLSLVLFAVFGISEVALPFFITSFWASLIPFLVFLIFLAYLFAYRALPKFSYAIKPLLISFFSFLVLTVILTAITQNFARLLTFYSLLCLIIFVILCWALACFGNLFPAFSPFSSFQERIETWWLKYCFKEELSEQRYLYFILTPKKRLQRNR